jgi:hypothetical protein
MVESTTNKEILRGRSVFGKRNSCEDIFTLKIFRKNECDERSR